ncbi:MAG: alpha/beta hydrolase [Alphaproteobacteria bacterium]|nr:alpha/beta hydrolase [Alphaproteobacteria bacterium]
MPTATAADQVFYFEPLGHTGPAVFWGHGWGHDHKAFLPLAQSLENTARHHVVDFPGFGQSPLPSSPWKTADYADAIAAFIKGHTSEKIIWVGHSFGCRVGIQLAARHPDLVAGLFLIAAAGLPRKRPLAKKLYFRGRIALYKSLKKLIPFGLPEKWLLKTFASPDYLKAGPLRQILVGVVNEDLSPQAASITCPTILLYGAQDTETPPEIGHRFARLIPESEIVVLDGFDHYSILSEARHQVVQRLNTFIKSIVSQK